MTTYEDETDTTEATSGEGWQVATSPVLVPSPWPFEEWPSMIAARLEPGVGQFDPIVANDFGELNLPGFRVLDQIADVPTALADCELLVNPYISEVIAWDDGGYLCRFAANAVGFGYVAVASAHHRADGEPPWAVWCHFDLPTDPTNQESPQ